MKTKNTALSELLQNPRKKNKKRKMYTPGTQIDNP